MSWDDGWRCLKMMGLCLLGMALAGIGIVVGGLALATARIAIVLARALGAGSRGCIRALFAGPAHTLRCLQRLVDLLEQGFRRTNPPDTSQ
jgi:hypothetical protein